MNRAGISLAERDAWYNGVMFGQGGAPRESYTTPEEQAAWDAGRATVK